MHICQAINAWDHPMTHPLQPTHDHLGIPMTRPRGSPAQSILDMMTLRPGWRCWHDPSRCHRPSIPEIKRANFITKFRYEEQWYTIEKWKSLYALYLPLELANWGGTNPGFTLEPITKIIYSKLRVRKWIMRSCKTYRHAKLKLIRRHQRQIMPTKLRMTSKRHHRAINIIIKHLSTMRGLWWSSWFSDSDFWRRWWSKTHSNYIAILWSLVMSHHCVIGCGYCTHIDPCTFNIHRSTIWVNINVDWDASYLRHNSSQKT